MSPEAWETRGGRVALGCASHVALGKQSGQRLVLIGTRAPAGRRTRGGRCLLETGSGAGTHIEVRTAPDGAPWDAWDNDSRRQSDGHAQSVAAENDPS